MTSEQSNAFAAAGPGWLNAGTAQLFFASIFSVLALFLLAAVVLDCYSAWHAGQMRLMEGGRLILETTFLMTALFQYAQ